MAKSKISQMSLDEIFEKVGDNIKVEQLRYIVTDIEKLNEEKCNPKEVVDYIKKYEDIIDKERLVYCITCNFQNACKYFENAKELLKDTNVEIADIVMKNGRLEVERFYTLDNFFGRKSNDAELKEKNQALLKEAEDNGILDKILANIFARDFSDCLCYYSGNGDSFKYMVEENYTNLVQASVKKQESLGKKLSEEEVQILAEMAYTQELLNVVKKYSHKIDVEKLMLLSAYRAKDSLTNYFDKMSIMNRNDCAQIMEYVSQKINPKLKMNDKVAELYTGRKGYIQYSTKELIDDVQRIVTAENGSKSYFQKQELVDTRNFVLKGQEPLSKIVKIGVFALLNFSAKEKQDLIKLDPRNFEILAILESLDKEEIKKGLENIGEYKLIITDYLYMNGLISKEDLVMIYMRNQADLTTTLDYHALYDLKLEVSVEDLMQYYSKMKEDNSKTKDFERYALLFREMKLKGQVSEQQTEIAEQIVEKIYETDGEYAEDFKRLYQSDLLPIRTVMDWNGEDIIYDLIANQQLKPCDAKDLLMTQELDIEKTYETLKNSDMSDEEKMNFIFSSFDGTGNNEEEIKVQNEARISLIQAIQISRDLIYAENSNSNKERKNIAEGAEKKQYITDPVYRWQLFSQIDSEFTSKVYLDGTVVFTLPNINNGTVVIEKMYKSTKEGTKINYGSATYVMAQEEFLNHKSEIEQERKINRRVLIQMMEEEKADKIVHSESWGKELEKKLGLSVERGYSQEKIAKIDELVSRIERARELVR